MVGWSRRNSESNARRRKFAQWWATLAPEERLAYEEERRRELERTKPWFVLVAVIWFVVAFGLVFVGAMR